MTWFFAITGGLIALFLLSIFTRAGRRCWAAVGRGMAGIAGAFDDLNVGSFD